MKVGILAIQGDFSLHRKSLDDLGVESIYVRSSTDLKKCSSLILPGGESTTMSLLLSRYKLNASICDFSLDHSIFGICAGSILMSKKSHDLRIKNLNLIKMESLRNAWGNQIDSFSDYINLNSKLNISEFYATFIRAPKFTNIDSSASIPIVPNTSSSVVQRSEEEISLLESIPETMEVPDIEGDESVTEIIEDEGPVSLKVGIEIPEEVKKEVKPVAIEEDFEWPEWE